MDSQKREILSYNQSNMTARLDSSWYIRPPDVRESIAAGGIVVCLKDDRPQVALVREKAYSEYILPKGEQEKGETLEETARREIGEEAGFSRLVLLGEMGKMERLNFRKTAWKVTHYFLFFSEQHQPKPTDANHEYVCEWFPLEALPPMFWEEQHDLIVSKKAEIEIRLDAFLRSRESLGVTDRILDNLSEAILILDDEGRCRYTNKAAKRLLAQTGNAIIEEFSNKAHTAGILLEEVFERDGQAPLIVEATVQPMPWQGAQARLVALRDITQVKAAQHSAYSQLIEAVEADLEREMRLTEVTRIISSALELSTILQNIITLSVDLVGADVGALGLVIPGTKRMTSPHLFNNTSEKITDLRALPRGEALAFYMVETGRPIFLTQSVIAKATLADESEVNEGVDSILTPDVARDLFQANINGIIGAPIAVGENQLGALLLYSRSTGRQFFHRLIALVESVGRQAGVAIQNARLYEEIQELATADPLTGLSNRRHFTEVAQREVERAIRYSRPLSLLMADIDFFKRVNDLYGHNVGDLVLQHIAGLMMANVRQSDVICRYGGEEFVVLMPETESDDARQVGERIRQQIVENPFQSAGQNIDMTISLGVVSMIRTGEDMDAEETLDDLVKKADEAMYSSKQNGRNRLTVYRENPD